MSIDARIIGIKFIESKDEIRLVLDDRPGGGLAGQESLIILDVIDHPEDKEKTFIDLAPLVDKDIWGGAGEIMIKDYKLADRVGYTGIMLVHNWREIISNLN